MRNKGRMVDRAGQRRTFGSVRKHRSGRWGADYTDPITGKRMTPGRSFTTKVGATRWLSEMQTDIDRGQAIDTVSSKRTFDSYATPWLAGRTDLRPKTFNLYEYLLRLYLVLHLGHVPVGKIDPSTIRRVSEGDQSAVTTAKALRQRDGQSVERHGQSRARHLARAMAQPS